MKGVATKIRNQRERHRTIESQSFVAEEGQTRFEITQFILSDRFLAIVENAPQFRDKVFREGNFVVAPLIQPGQTITIIN